MKKWIVTAALAVTLITLSPAAAWANAPEGDAQTVSGSNIVVGDGVTATFNEVTGEVVLYSKGGTLWKDWVDKSGIEPKAIKSLEVSENSGKVYLPEDSSEIFSLGIKTLDLKGFDSSKVKNMNCMFAYDGIEELDVSYLDTSNVTDMGGMFKGCQSLRELDLSNFDTSHVTDMSLMFTMCASLVKLNLTSFDTSKVMDMSIMFDWCGCRSVDLSGFDTSNVIRMDYMFWESSLYCGDSKEHVFDLSSFDMSKVKSATDMLAGRGQKIRIPKNVSCDVSVGLMFDSEGNAYKSLPNVTESIILMDFHDVTDPEKWYHKPVYWAFEKGITSGYGPYTFQPMATLNRAQAVTFLYKMAGKPELSGLEGQSFTDVSADAWFHDAVMWAAANGITKGYGEGTFQPYAPCNRAMIVTFLANYAKNVAGTYKEPTSSSNFTDVAANAWYKESVDWAAANSITTGYEQGKFQPDTVCNRAMMVTFLKRVSDLSNVG